VETSPNEWVDDLYFEIAAKIPLDETTSTTVKSDDIGFWPPGNALAIFFGPTPTSDSSDPVPASAVIVGRIVGNSSVLMKAKGASIIRFEKV
jgi:hypothetical protein